jgi:hypothetical protein
VLLLPASLRAQSATEGALTGTVADATGAALPNTELRLQLEGTSEVQTLHSAADGSFTVPALDPGTWRVSAGRQQASFMVEVGRTTTLPLVLTPRSLQYVTVVAETDDEDGAAVTTNITPQQIAALPVNARRWNDFALLAPTATPDGGLGSAGGDISFRGISGLLNQTALDGGSTTSAFAAQDNPRTRAAFTVSQSAVREFQVNVANYSAQYGRAAGAVINTITDRGQDHFHGSASLFDRDNSWLSRTAGTQLVLPQPDGTLVPQQLPSDNRLQGSVALGGTVPLERLRHRVYWHYTLDQQHRSFPALSTVTNSPQAALSQALPADDTGFNPIGETCAALTTGPLAYTGSETTNALYGTQGACFLNLYGSTLYADYAQAAAAYNNALAYVYSLLGPAGRHSTLVSNLPRVDLDLNSANMLTLAWNSVRSYSPGGGTSQPYVNDSVTSLGDDHLALDDVSARLNSLLTTHLDNELRAGYARDSESEEAQPPLPQEPHTALNGTAAPAVRIRETLTLGTPPQLPRSNYPRESRVQFADAAAFVRGAHTWRAGVDVLHTADAVDNLNAAAGSFAYDNIQNFLIDYASQNSGHSENCGGLCYSTFEQGFGQPGLSFSGNQYAAYAQDDWKFSPALTVTLGLRYDHQQLPPPQLPNAALAATQQFPSDRAGFAPRLGFAWKLPRAGHAVLRGGYGIFRATTPGTTIFNALINTGVLSSQDRGQARYRYEAGTASSGAQSPGYPNVLAAPPDSADLNVPAPNVTVFASHFRQPYVQQASLTVESELTSATVVHATGLLSLARELPITVDTNLLPPGSNNLPSTVTYLFQGGGPLNGQTETVPFYAGQGPYARPNNLFGAINTVDSRVNATYSALNVGIRHSTTRQLNLLAHYTWSHAVDYGQQISASATRSEVLDPNNFAAERGNSTLNRPSRFVLAAIYSPVADNVPPMLHAALNGWQLSPIVQIASGAPYSAIITGTAPAQENAVGSQTIKPASHGFLGAGGDDFLPILGRNRYRQPLTQITDLRIARAIPTGLEKLRLNAVAEFFNLFNHRNIASADTNSAVSTLAYQISSGQAGLGTPSQPAIATWQPGFGQPLAVNATNLFTSRQMQFSLRAQF